MDIEEHIKNCEAEIKWIENYDPDPYYVNYFFQAYLNSVNMAYDGIFKEASRDFGLFVPRCNKESFKEKSIQKDDHDAIGFVSWYEKNMQEEHKSQYATFMQKIIKFHSCYKRLPKITAGIRAKSRYGNDIFQTVPISLSDGRLRTKEGMQIEVNRQIPIFLEVINHKRKKNGEPTVSEDEVAAATFFEGFENFEISYAVKVYIRVVRRIVSDSREKIKELTAWK